ncbi:MAG: hypothetical protein B7Z23_08260 [Pseudomonadales bacterium 32-61-5]|nr:MAG: hypothetical protein B7Z23_08260 [Pseudomonadales bacterium 32-61-5]
MLLAATSAQAGPYILPSAVQFEGKEAYVTVDASTAEHAFDLGRAIPLDGLVITGPDGGTLTPDTTQTGRARSSFELKLTRPGTYRFAIVQKSAFGSYMLNGEAKRFRGNADTYTKDIPAGATDIKVSTLLSRYEAYTSLGAPNDKALALAAEGLQIIPQSSPSELIAGESTTFVAYLDGEPIADLDLRLIPGGARFRGVLKDVAYKTGPDGRFTVSWSEGGLYNLVANYPPRQPQGQAGDAASRGAGQPERRVSFSATFEVQPF